MFATVILLCQAAVAVLSSKHLILQTLRFWNPWCTSHDKTILRAVFMYTLVFIQTSWSAFCTNQKKPQSRYNLFCKILSLFQHIMFLQVLQYFCKIESDK